MAAARPFDARPGHAQCPATMIVVGSSVGVTCQWRTRRRAPSRPLWLYVADAGHRITHSSVLTLVGKRGRIAATGGGDHFSGRCSDKNDEQYICFLQVKWRDCLPLGGEEVQSCVA